MMATRSDITVTLTLALSRMRAREPIPMAVRRDGRLGDVSSFEFRLYSPSPAAGRGRGEGHLARPKLPFENLSRGIPGQRIDELDKMRRLVVRDSIAAKGDDLRFRQR